MTDSEQRAAYVAAQIESIHQNLRFLEAVVTQPIGLTTDLKTLRQSVPATGAAEERDRQAFLDVVERGKNPKPAGLDAAASVASSIELLQRLAPEGVSGLREQWVSGAAKVLERVTARLGEDVRRSKAENLRGGLYVIVDPEHTHGRSVDEIARAAVAGGAAAIQLRDKRSGKGEVLASARRLQQICTDGGELFFANDDADIARLAGADGLHVGQTDLPIAEARRVLPSDRLVGRSNAVYDEAIASESDSADYVAVGSIYDSLTKPSTRQAGLETLRRVAEVVRVPVVAIGGINESNVGPVLEAGADAVCVISAVSSADDPEAAVRRLADIVDSAV